MDLRNALCLSRKLPAQHVETLWENIYKYNVNIDTLKSILAFYMHHRVYPPPVQKAFDTLLMTFTDSKVPKKFKTLLFQTVEEMCHWLIPTCITETVTVSTSSSVVAELLPCFLINKNIPLPDFAFHDRLINALTTPGLTQDDRIKVLGYLMNTDGLPTLLEPKLNKQLVAWLSYSRTAQSLGTLFKSLDITEIDGSPGMGLCTVLTLAVTIADIHLLSLVAFSNLRRYLYRTHDRADMDLTNAVFNYCTSLLAQASKQPKHSQDNQLISGVLEEVLLLMKVVKNIDVSFQSRCQLLVNNVQMLASQLRLTFLLVSVWQYHLSLAVPGDEVRLTKMMLTNVIQSEYSHGAVSQKLAWTIAEYSDRPPLAPSLPQHMPNILKLIATHPSALVEEFLDIVPQLTSDPSLVIEALHSLLDLPLLSASIYVHQTALLVKAGIKVPSMIAVRQSVEVSHSVVYHHFLRPLASPGQTDELLKLYPAYWSTLWPILSTGLVQVCSQVAPLLLQAFLESASSCQDINTLIIPALLSRVLMLCPISTYQTAVFGVVGQYMTRVCNVQPQLLEVSDVAQFLSDSNHARLYPQLYMDIVNLVGEHIKEESLSVNVFDTMEAVLRETMSTGAGRNVPLETSICTTLAKLASRNVNLIPQTISAFEKLGRTLVSASESKKEVLSLHTKELIRILKNPRVAGVVLTPSSKEDIAIAALMRVLFQFLD